MIDAWGKCESLDYVDVPVSYEAIQSPGEDMEEDSEAGSYWHSEFGVCPA
jgi:hypothetical protein